jgi:hypothetical protein
MGNFVRRVTSDLFTARLSATRRDHHPAKWGGHVKNLLGKAACHTVTHLPFVSQIKGQSLRRWIGFLVEGGGGNKGKEKGWEDGTFSLAASCARDEREREHKARPDGDTVKNKYCKDALNTELEEGRISPGSRRNDQQPCSNAWRRVDLGARREPNHLVYRRIRSRGQSI